MMKLTEYRKLAVIGGLAIVLMFFVNLSPVGLIFKNLESVLGLLFLMFFPGYLFVHLLFGDKLELLEDLVLSVGLSVSLAILVSMAVYFAGLEITFVNIFNSLTIAVFGLILANVFANAFKMRTSNGVMMKELKPKWRPVDKDFYVHVVLVVAVLVMLSYLSSFLRPKEEFVEINWVTSEVKDVRAVDGVSCTLENCGLSGSYKIGRVKLNGRDFDEEFEILITDLDEVGEYDAFCIDINDDGRYCGGSEGPFRYYETFFVGSSAYISLMFSDDKFVFVNYPEYIYSDEFKTSFAAKSMYSKEVTFLVGVTVNGKQTYNETVDLEYGEEIVRSIEMPLVDEGLHKIEASIRPMKIDGQGAKIHFWADRRI